jgi:5-methylcytosine-specific restriction endonuclease McrA
MADTPRLRNSLAEPIPECFHAASLLQAALVAHQAGETTKAAALLAEADMPEVRAFTEQMWGPGGKELHAFKTLPDTPQYLQPTDRPKPRMPTAATKAALISRDGFHCRFCGLPVIRAQVRARIQSAYPQSVGWGSTNFSQHAALQCLWLQYDHVLPNSRGGPSTLENMVVTCACCNFGRMETTLEEAWLIDPLSRVTPRKWDGFETWVGMEDFE